MGDQDDLVPRDRAGAPAPQSGSLAVERGQTPRPAALPNSLPDSYARGGGAGGKDKPVAAKKTYAAATPVPIWQLTPVPPSPQ
jgi:hypothetical protein